MVHPYHLCQHVPQQSAHVVNKIAKVIKLVQEINLGQYYYVSVEFQVNRKVFKVGQVIRQHFQSLAEYQAFEVKLLPLGALLCSIPVQLLLQKYQRFQGLLENSAFSACGLAAISASEETFARHFQIRHRGQVHKEKMFSLPQLIEGVKRLLGQLDVSYQVPQRLFIRYFDYFANLSLRPLIEAGLNFAGIRAAKTLAFLVPSMLKWLGKYSLAQQISERLSNQCICLQQRLRENYVETQTLLLLLLKLQLIRLEMYFKTAIRKQSNYSKDVFREAWRLTEQINKDSPLLQMFLLELDYLRAYVAYKQLKHQSPPNHQSLFDQLRELNSKIMMGLDQRGLLKAACWQNFRSRYVLLCARKLSLSKKYNFKLELDEQSTLKQLQTAACVFSESGLLNLQARALLESARIMSRESLQLLQKTYEFRQFLGRIGALLNRHEFVLTKKKFEDELRGYQTAVELKLTECAHKLVVVSRVSNYSGGICFRKEYGFKRRMEEMIRESQREINIKFELLTKATLQNCIRAGGYLTFLYAQGQCLEQDQVLLEHNKLPAHAYCALDDQSLAAASLSEAVTEVLVVIGGRAEELARGLADYFHAQNVFAVDMQGLQNQENDDLRKQAVNQFCVQLLKRLLAGEQQKVAFNLAFTACVNYTISNSNRSIVNLRQFQKCIASDKIVRLTDRKLQVANPGRFQNVSSRNKCAPPENLLIRRHRLVARVGEMLQVSNWYDSKINIFGPEGSGKTTLAYELRYQLSGSQLFPDGIFIVPCLKYSDSLQKLMEESLGCTLSELSRKQEFGMLILFDDYETLTRTEDVFMPHLFQTLLEKQVQMVFFTKKSLERAKSPFRLKFQAIELAPMSPPELEWLLRESLPRELCQFTQLVDAAVREVLNSCNHRRVQLMKIKLLELLRKELRQEQAEEETREEDEISLNRLSLDYVSAKKERISDRKDSSKKAKRQKRR